jgi:hypothetical protein
MEAKERTVSETKNNRNPFASPFSVRSSGFSLSRPIQPAEIALTGHSSAQSPQSTHLSASITYCSSPSLIASDGQTGSQLPHFVHSLEIT